MVLRFLPSPDPISCGPTKVEFNVLDCRHVIHGDVTKLPASTQKGGGVAKLVSALHPRVEAGLWSASCRIPIPSALAKQKSNSLLWTACMSSSGCHKLPACTQNLFMVLRRRLIVDPISFGQHLSNSLHWTDCHHVILGMSQTSSQHSKEA